MDQNEDAINKLERQYMKKVEEVESLKSSLQNKEKEFEVIAEKIASLEQECAAERTKSQALQEKLLTLQSSSNRAEEALREEKGKVQALQQTVSDLEALNVSEKKEHVATTERLNQVESDLVKEKGEKQQLQGDLSVITQKCASFEAELGEIKAANADLLNKLQQTKDDLQKKLSEGLARETAIKKQLESALRTVPTTSPIQSAVDTISSQSADGVDTLVSLKKLREEYVLRQSELEKKYNEKIQVQEKAQSQKLIAYESNLKLEKSKNRELVEKLKALETQNASSRTHIDSLFDFDQQTKVLDEKKRECLTEKKKREAAEADLKFKTAQLDEKNEELALKAQQVEQLQKENEKLSLQLISERENTKRAEVQRNSLLQELKTFKEKSGCTSGSVQESIVASSPAPSVAPIPTANERNEDVSSVHPQGVIDDPPVKQQEAESRDVHHLKQSNASLENGSTLLQGESKKLIEELNDTKRQLDVYVKMYKELMSSSAETSATNMFKSTPKDGSAENISGEIERLKRENDKLRQTVNKQAASIAELNTKVVCLPKLLANYKSACKDLEEAQKTHLNLIDQLGSELSKALKTIDVVTKEKDKCEEDLHKLKREVTKLQTDMDRLQRERAWYCKEGQRYKEENERAVKTNTVLSDILNKNGFVFAKAFGALKTELDANKKLTVSIEKDLLQQRPNKESVEQLKECPSVVQSQDEHTTVSSEKQNNISSDKSKLSSHTVPTTKDNLQATNSTLKNIANESSVSSSAPSSSSSTVTPTLPEKLQKMHCELQKERIDSLEAVKAVYKELCETLRREQAKYPAEREELLKKIEKLECDTSKLADERNTVQAEYEKLSTILSDKEKELKLASQRIESDKAQLAECSEKLQAEIAGKTRDFALFRDELSEKALVKEALEKQTARAEELAAKLEQVQKEAAKEREDLTKKLTSVQKENEKQLALNKDLAQKLSGGTLTAVTVPEECQTPEQSNTTVTAARPENVRTPPSRSVEQLCINLDLAKSTERLLSFEKENLSLQLEKALGLLHAAQQENEALKRQQAAVVATVATQKTLQASDESTAMLKSKCDGYVVLLAEKDKTIERYKRSEQDSKALTKLANLFMVELRQQQGMAQSCPSDEELDARIKRGAEFFDQRYRDLYFELITRPPSEFQACLKYMLPAPQRRTAAGLTSLSASQQQKASQPSLQKPATNSTTNSSAMLSGNQPKKLVAQSNSQSKQVTHQPTLSLKQLQQGQQQKKQQQEKQQQEKQQEKQNVNNSIVQKRKNESVDTQNKKQHTEKQQNDVPISTNSKHTQQEKTLPVNASGSLHEEQSNDTQNK